MDVEEDDEVEVGPDGDLVVSIVTLAVIPRLIKLVAGGAFDPYSSKHLRRLTDLTEQVEMCVSREDAKFQVRLSFSEFWIFIQFLN